MAGHRAAQADTPTTGSLPPKEGIEPGADQGIQPAAPVPVQPASSITVVFNPTSTQVVSLPIVTDGKAWTVTIYAAPAPDSKAPTDTGSEVLVIPTVAPNTTPINQTIDPKSFQATFYYQLPPPGRSPEIVLKGAKLPRVTLAIPSASPTPTIPAALPATPTTSPTHTTNLQTMSTVATTGGATKTDSGQASGTLAAIPSQETGTRKKSHAGVIAGVVVVVLFLVLVGIAVFMVYTGRWGKKRRRRRPQIATRSDDIRHDEHSQMEEQPQVIGAYMPGRDTKNSNQLIFDQPKDNDAIKSLFDGADDILADHIENYYIPDGEMDAAQQWQQLPHEESVILMSNSVLSRSRKLDLLSQPNTRVYALRAMASYYLYEAIMDDKFLPQHLKEELEAMKRNRDSYTRQNIIQNRLVLFHRFVHSNDYASAIEERVARLAQRLDGVLAPFAVSRDPERVPSLQKAIRRFAELAVTLGKQPAMYKTELRLKDFSYVEVSKKEKDEAPKRVKYTRSSFDGTRMEVENRGTDLTGGKVRAVVAPGIRKYSPEQQKMFEESELIRKAKVILL